MAQAVQTPWPASVWPMRMVTVSSGAITIQALISGTAGSRYQVAPCWVEASARFGGSQRPKTIDPPTAAVALRNSRRRIPARSTLAIIRVVMFVLAVMATSCLGGHHVGGA